MDDDTMISVHRRALDATGTVIVAIGPSQWTAPTPCDGWDVKTLVNHLVGGNLWAAELAAGRTIEAVGTALDGDLLGDDPAGAYERSAGSVTRAFEAPGALAAPCAVSYGPVPGSVYLGHRIIDVLIHGWDLAVATGQDRGLDPQLVAACTEIVEPQLDALRASGAFGKAGPQSAGPPGSPDGQAALLAMLGRRP
jgi:uncharacterized protein (TIGR03086 family)